MVFQSRRRSDVIYENIAFGIRLYEKLPKSELDDRWKPLETRGAVGRVKSKLGANA